MTMRTVSSRADCAYCGAHARPNAMYCMHCGQIVTAAPKPASSNSAAHVFSPQPQQPIVPEVARAPLQQHLPPMPSVPSIAGAPRPQPEPEAAVPPPLPRLSGASRQHAQIVELALASGARAQVHGTTVLGRMPEATARNSGAQAITIPDDTKSVSRAHAIIEQHGQAVTISDAGSANGSVVERDGNVLVLSEGRQISLRDGDRIWLGDVPLDVYITSSTRQSVTRTDHVTGRRSVT